MKTHLVVLALDSNDDDARLSDLKRRSTIRVQSDGIPKKELVKVTRVQRSKRIVLVDDDSEIRNILRSILKMKGFQVSASLSDGAELVKLIDGFDPKPDVILLDERMPRMSGVDAFNIVHPKYPDISIVFISADESAEKRARKAGARAFLRKPVSISELLNLISSI